MQRYVARRFEHTVANDLGTLEARIERGDHADEGALARFQMVRDDLSRGRERGHRVARFVPHIGLPRRGHEVLQIDLHFRCGRQHLRGPFICEHLPYKRFKNVGVGLARREGFGGSAAGRFVHDLALELQPEFRRATRL